MYFFRLLVCVRKGATIGRCHHGYFINADAVAIAVVEYPIHAAFFPIDVSNSPGRSVMKKGSSIFVSLTQSSLRHRSRPTNTRSKMRRLKSTPSQYALLGVHSISVQIIETLFA